MSLWRKTALALRRFADREDGSGTMLSLLFLASTLFVAGMAIDLSRLQALTVRMQNTADNAAYAAMMQRTFGTEQVATAAALSSVAANMPASVFGEAVLAADVEWGTWDAATNTFTKAAGATGAVRVSVRQVQGRMNAFRNSLLNLVGRETFDATRRAVVLADDGRGCAGKRDGFTAQLLVNFTSNATLREGFCIHSNTGVSFNMNTTIEPGVAITMPNALPEGQGGNLKIPTAAYTPAVRATLGNARYTIGLLAQMPRIIQSIEGSPSTSRFTPAYIQAGNRSWEPITVSGSKLDVTSSTFQSGRMYKVTCTASNQDINFGNNITVQRVVLLTNCPVKFANDNVWEQSLLLSTYQDTTKVAVDGAQGMRIGASDGCSAGGGAQILTYGSVAFPANMEVFGGQIVALQTIRFAAGGSGVRGISLVSGEEIRGTANMDMWSCGNSGMEANITVPTARLVQ